MSTNGIANRTRKSIRAPNPPVEDSVFRQFWLDGRTAIITGGAGGIGSEVARGLAEAGANSAPLKIAIWYHNSKAAVVIAEGIAKDFGVKTKAYRVDVTDYSGVKLRLRKLSQTLAVWMS
ncbi:short chain dehydrogenase [Colletotrichum tofieldiae]|nr:short chain dehydrogenase [Colletotrichum tofieldiae]